MKIYFGFVIMIMRFDLNMLFIGYNGIGVPFFPYEKEVRTQSIKGYSMRASLFGTLFFIYERRIN